MYKNRKALVITFAAVLLLCATAASSHLYARNMQVLSLNSSKEVSASSARKGASEDGNSSTALYSDITDIPVCSGYSVKLTDNKLAVSDIQGKTLYVDNDTDITAFSDADICKLRQDGIYISCRSELLEMLNYFRS